jgi:hypothetical protein
LPPFPAAARGKPHPPLARGPHQATSLLFSPPCFFSKPQRPRANRSTPLHAGPYPAHPAREPNKPPNRAAPAVHPTPRREPSVRRAPAIPGDQARDPDRLSPTSRTRPGPARPCCPETETPRHRTATGPEPLTAAVSPSPLTLPLPAPLMALKPTGTVTPSPRRLSLPSALYKSPATPWSTPSPAEPSPFLPPARQNLSTQHPGTRSKATYSPSSPCSRYAQLAVVKLIAGPSAAVRRSSSVEPHRSSRPTVRTHCRNYVVRCRRNHAAHQLCSFIPRLKITPTR